MVRKEQAECGPTDCRSAAASAVDGLQKSNDLEREAVGWNGVLARFWLPRCYRS